MIKRESKEWDAFIQQIEFIKSKSNRQVLCIKCWLILNYEQKIKHVKENPGHEASILTSAKFASSQQILSLAQGCQKMVYKTDGEYLISPFHGISRHIVENQEPYQSNNEQVPSNNLYSRDESRKCSSENSENSSQIQQRIDKLETEMQEVKN